MKRFALIIVLIVAASIFPTLITVVAQSAMSRWPFYAEVTTPAGAPGAYDLTLPLQVLDKSREDLADLRLYDTNGKEIPYALRIRREVDDTREVSGRLFNQAHVGTNTSEVSVDLGENSGEHNLAEIETAGTNFRRRVEVEGSDSGSEWKILKAGEVIFGFESQNHTVQSNGVSYPTSRYRYLRVRVFADELTDKQAPVITNVKASMTVRAKGELANWDVPVPAYQLLRNQGVPASSWTLDLGGRVPCDRLALVINADSFSRPFQLEAIDDPQNIRLIASGELTRRIGQQQPPVVINFEQEEHARKLRLLVTDYNNETLPISSITAGAPARQLVFELKEPTNQPLRLFFGNPKATDPHYDFAKDQAVRISAQTSRGVFGAVSANPDYKPEPLPLTERIPWLIYIVLAASSLALAFILINLVRTTLRKQPQPNAGSNAG
jgi:Protein of unknown function (DUF3999)